VNGEDAVPRVQVIALKKFESIWTVPMKPGDVAWVTDKAANHLLRAGLVALPEQLPETQPAPGLVGVKVDVVVSDTPPEPVTREEVLASGNALVMEPEPPKSVGERTDGPKTDSPLSSESGPEIPPSALEAGQA
jgi:hypothetical protein